MSEIEVGEYIRTNRGIIAKVIYIREATRYRCTSGTISHSPERYFLDNEQKHSVSIGYVKAHSKNIIDLIEVGDFVNGNLVLDIDVEDGMICLLMPFDEENQTNFNVVWNTKYFIKTILTHELYEQNCYKVVE